jgi:integrase
VSVYKRKSGRWQVCVDVDRGADGVRRRRKLGTFRTRKEAESAEREALAAFERGIDLSPRVVLLAEVMRRYLDDREHRCGEKTIERYRELERLYIAPHLGGLALSRLRPAHISEWLSMLQKRGGAKKISKDATSAPIVTPRPLSPRTVRHAHSLLKSALLWAINLQLTATNPAAIVEAPPLRRSDVRALSPDEVAALFTAAQGSRWSTLLAVALFTGARRGELAALRWPAMDLDVGTMTIRAALSQTRAGISVKSTKTDRVRTIPLSPLALDALRRQRDTQFEELKALAAGDELEARRRQKDGYVFTNPLGASLVPWAVTDAFRRLAGKAKLVGVSFHALRHTAATWMVSAGVDARSAADILGHSTPATTLAIYSHAVASAKIAAVLTIDNRLASVR